MDPRTRIIRTLIVIASWVCIGLYSGITGPTLLSLKHNVNSNFEEISRALVARSAGFFVGSIMGGVLCTKYARLTDLWIGMALLVGGLATIAAPWCRVLTLLAVVLFLDGTAKGIIGTGGNALVMQMWGDKAAAPCHAVHFAFGVGALTSPQIARPFLPEIVQPNENPSIEDSSRDILGNVSSTTELYNTSTLGFNSTVPIADHSRIVYAYLIVGLITITSSLSFFVLLFATKAEGIAIKDNKPPEKLSFKEIFHPESCIKGNKKVFGYLFLVAIMIYFMLPIGAERAYGKFLYSYSTQGDLHFTKDKGTALETTFWAMFTVGRGIATLVSKWLPPIILVIIDLSLSIIVSIVLVIYGQKNEIILYVFTGLLGPCISVGFPSAMVWGSRYIDFNAMAMATSYLSTAIGAIIFSWLGGYLFEYHGEQSLMWLMLVYSILLILMFIVLYSLTKFYGVNANNKTANEEKKEQEENNLKL